MRIFKRLIQISAVLVILAGLGLAYAYHLTTRQPDGYAPDQMSAEQREVAAVEMNRKVESLDILANEAQAWARSLVLKQQGKPATPIDKPQPVTQSFNQDQLNAYLNRWWTGPVKAKAEAYLSQPYIRLDDGNIVLMGTVAEYGKVLSAYFEPRIDEKGMLRCDLTSVRLGSLPLPGVMLSQQREKLSKQLKGQLELLRAEASMDETGLANNAVGKAVMARMLLSAFDGRPVPAAVFMPRDDQRQLPIRLTGVRVEKGQITLSAAPFELAELATLREKIKEPYEKSEAGEPGANLSAELPRK
ncbi:MAG TPA: hypothetical protein VEA69_11815 [Tepidisphaeraceae bacterium]|nr:hypothetical protein [Tepidisphaeraceae bacterium]